MGDYVTKHMNRKIASLIAAATRHFDIPGALEPEDLDLLYARCCQKDPCWHHLGDRAFAIIANTGPSLRTIQATMQWLVAVRSNFTPASTENTGELEERWNEVSQYVREGNSLGHETLRWHTEGVGISAYSSYHAWSSSHHNMSEWQCPSSNSLALFIGEEYSSMLKVEYELYYNKIKVRFSGSITEPKEVKPIRESVKQVLLFDLDHCAGILLEELRIGSRSGCWNTSRTAKLVLPIYEEIVKQRANEVLGMLELSPTQPS